MKGVISVSKRPQDRTLYPRHPDSRPIRLGLDDGAYVFVQDEAGTIYILADGPHRHPLVLGGARAALYAGDLTIVDGLIHDITNLSGTFQFDEPQGLLDVVQRLERMGFDVPSGAVRFFPVDGSRPSVLR